MKITTKQVSVIMWMIVLGVIILLYSAVSAATDLEGMVVSARPDPALAGHLQA